MFLSRDKNLTIFFDRDSNMKFFLLPGLEAQKVENHWSKQDSGLYVDEVVLPLFLSRPILNRSIRILHSLWPAKLTLESEQEKILFLNAF